MVGMKTTGEPWLGQSKQYIIICVVSPLWRRCDESIIEEEPSHRRHSGETTQIIIYCLL
jgi:hypothetical protein